MGYTIIYVRQDGADWVLLEEGHPEVLGRYLTRAQALDAAQRRAQSHCPCHIYLTDGEEQYSEIWGPNGIVPPSQES